MMRYDGFKRMIGTKIHVVVESNGLSISIVMSLANNMVVEYNIFTS